MDVSLFSADFQLPTTPEERIAFFENNHMVLNLLAMNYDNLLKSTSSSDEDPERDHFFQLLKDFKEYSQETVSGVEAEAESKKDNTFDIGNALENFASFETPSYTPFEGDRETHIRLSRRFYKNTPIQFHDFTDVLENEKRLTSMMPEPASALFEESIANAKKNIPGDLTLTTIFEERFPVMNKIMKLVQEVYPMNMTDEKDYDGMSDDEVIECYEEGYKRLCSKEGPGSFFSTPQTDSTQTTTDVDDETKVKLGEALLPLIGDALTEFQQILDFVNTPYQTSE
jgi:hypothetical protein